MGVVVVGAMHGRWYYSYFLMTGQTGVVISKEVLKSIRKCDDSPHASVLLQPPSV